MPYAKDAIEACDKVTDNTYCHVVPYELCLLRWVYVPLPALLRPFAAYLDLSRTFRLDFSLAYECPV